MVGIAGRTAAIGALAALCLASPVFADERDDLIAGCEVELVTPTTDCERVADTMLSEMKPDVRALFLEITADMDAAFERIEELEADKKFHLIDNFMDHRMRSECNDE